MIYVVFESFGFYLFFFFEGMKGKMTSIFLTENWLAVMLHVSVADFVKFLKLEFGSLHEFLIGF